MASIYNNHVPDNRLRFIFNDTVVAVRLAANATFEDIARTLGKLPRQRYGDPLAIDVTLAPDVSVRANARRSGYAPR
ncbi:MAG: hypothetical protein IH626_13115 [Rhodospirillales bacterium]|nr:hypothetical protein [Rhodospirillales bacterium]